jgi:hypothetical protein
MRLQLVACILNCSCTRNQYAAHICILCALWALSLANAYLLKLSSALPLKRQNPPPAPAPFLLADIKTLSRFYTLECALSDKCDILSAGFIVHLCSMSTLAMKSPVYTPSRARSRIRPQKFLASFDENTFVKWLFSEGTKKLQKYNGNRQLESIFVTNFEL